MSRAVVRFNELLAEWDGLDLTALREAFLRTVREQRLADDPEREARGVWLDCAVGDALAEMDRLSETWPE